MAYVQYLMRSAYSNCHVTMRNVSYSFLLLKENNSLHQTSYLRDMLRKVQDMKETSVEESQHQQNPFPAVTYNHKTVISQVVSEHKSNKQTMKREHVCEAQCEHVKLVPEAALTELINTDQSIDESLSITQDYLDKLSLSDLTPSPVSGSEGTAATGYGSLHLSSVIRKHETLQQLVALGINLHKAGSKPGALNDLLHCSWDRDVYPILEWLNRKGFNVTQVADIFSFFPGIMKLSLDALEERWHYLTEKRFPEEKLPEMLSKNAEILSLSVVKLDTMLGQIQTIFRFSASELRTVVLHSPKIVSRDIGKIKESVIVMRHACGFFEKEIRPLVISNPEIILTNVHNVAKNFKLLQAVGIQHEAIVPVKSVGPCTNLPVVLELQMVGGCSKALSAPHVQLKQRISYLQSRGRFQPDSSKPLFTPINQISTVSNEEFCKSLAKSSYEEFIAFIKTL